MEEGAVSTTPAPAGDPPQEGGGEQAVVSTTQTTTTSKTAAAPEGGQGSGGSAAGLDGWVNIGEQTWAALRHEWKYKPPGKKDEKPRERKRIDPDVIYTDVTSRGQLSQPVPLSDLVNVLTWVWETDSNW